MTARSTPRLTSALLLAAIASTLLGVLVADSVAADAATPPSEPCLAPASWAVFDHRQVQAANKQQLLADLVGRDVLLLGEQHDDAEGAGDK